MSNYTEEFRASIVKKALLLDSKTSLRSFSKDEEINISTIRGWINKYKNATNIETVQLPKSYNDEKKFEALLEYKSKNESELGEWLRLKGLKSEHLKLWEEEMKKSVTKNNMKEIREENKKLKQEKLLLEKDIVRKNAALAEVTALLTLKKKVNMLRGIEED